VGRYKQALEVTTKNAEKRRYCFDVIDMLGIHHCDCGAFLRSIIEKEKAAAELRKDQLSPPKTIEKELRFGGIGTVFL
jgi:hypothetical protein